MIISGEDTKLISKGANNADNSSSPASANRRGGSSDPPPSYQAAQIPPSQSHIPPQGYAIPQQPGYRQSPRRRFWRAFMVAILIWILLTLLVRSTYDFARWGRRYVQNVWRGDFPVPANIILSHCVSGTDWADAPHPDHLNTQDSNLSTSRFPYASRTLFELPLSYKTLFLLARGSQTYGTVNVITSDEVTDVAKVYFTVNYYSEYLRDQGVKVCLIKRASNEIGVGFFTRQWYGADHGLYYDATVVLPATRNRKAPLQVTNFETDVPNTSHRLGDLTGVNFAQIDLKGSNAPISAQSFFADTAILRTSNSPITGVYNTSRSLTLKTSNSPIQVDVGVHNERKYVSELLMHTTNGKLDSRVSLTSPNQQGGRYLVAATTSNSPLAVKFQTSPLDSTLKLVAGTSNSPALVSLDPAYEGTFSLSTSNYSPLLNRRTVEDPSGKGRKRVVQARNYSRGVLKGSVSWSARAGSGTVEVKSSNSSVTLEL
ncbi:putative expressed protein [Lyophyllum shimeji]|uniref:Expressed protein n=1 Tax=Lyophyllum shimeji TaxID=47721 RepID=A0A9P3PK13_LYOSH|nr:putative expressed protein [Lyophyllum shimeji]